MLEKKNAYRIVIAGATGAVGREMIEILEERNFPVSELVLLESEHSEGERVEFKGTSLAVKRLGKDSFAGADIALFSAGEEWSLEFASAAVGAGAVVIDNSSAFRMDPAVPLVIPEVNGHRITGQAGIIANPSCSTIGMVMALKPIHDAVTVRRVVVTTLQSVSDAGKEAMDELAGQTVALLNFRDVEVSVFPHQIAFNCLPHIDAFLEDGFTKEERNLAQETRKILEDDAIGITATTVRVPVFRCHAASINVETERAITPNDARAALACMPGVMVYDDPVRNIYPLQLDAAGKDEVYVGRIRQDETVSNGLHLWIVSDNLRKGAALNAVQIAELLIK